MIMIYLKHILNFGPEISIENIKDFVSKLEKNSEINNKKKENAYIEEISGSFIDSFGNVMIDIINFNTPFITKGKIRIKFLLGPYVIPIITISSDFFFLL